MKTVSIEMYESLLESSLKVTNNNTKLIFALKRVKKQIQELSKELHTYGTIPYGGLGTIWIDELLAEFSPTETSKDKA